MSDYLDNLLCCGAPGPEHASWCWPAPACPVPAWGSPVGPSWHEGRFGLEKPCRVCHAPAGDPCWASPLPGPVVELHDARPVTVAGAAAGWGRVTLAPASPEGPLGGCDGRRG